MTLTVFYNYTNWKQWNNNLETIKISAENGGTDIIELAPYITSRENPVVSNFGVRLINIYLVQTQEHGLAFI